MRHTMAYGLGQTSKPVAEMSHEELVKACSESNSFAEPAIRQVLDLVQTSPCFELELRSKLWTYGPPAILGVVALGFLGAFIYDYAFGRK